MIRKQQYFCLSVFLWALILNSTEAAEKSSLTFVIDDTLSMTDDIDAVKESANTIFDTVTNSNASFIEDFVLVTVNDPVVVHVTTTKDRDVYRKAINSLYTHNVDNPDCPELSMTGIELALKLSRPGSLLYVFTDASAKDPEKHEAVKNLAHQKSIQVVFVLTDDCGYGDMEVYDKVAQETSGQVFNIYKSQIKSIIDYIISQINSRKEVLAKKQFSAGTHQFPFEVDSTIEEIVISVSGKNPKVTITDPVGDIAPMEKNQTDNFAILKITTVKPGTYTAEITSDTSNSVLITADTSVHFEHGFSTFVPATMQDTVKRPLPDVESYISIQLIIDGDNDIVLDTVQIIDLDNKILYEEPLRLSDDKELYISNTTFTPPKDDKVSSPLFRVAIKGHDTKSNEYFTRISLTPIEAQKADTHISISNKKPEVTIIKGTKISAEYNESLVLKCKVNAYPKPSVKWQTSGGTLLPSTLYLVEHPDYYISTLVIDHVISNITYHCIANNDYGADNKQIQIETVRKTYFTVIKEPRNAVIEINMDSQIECEVDAFPPADINWYKNRMPLIEDDNVKISLNQSVLSFKNMQPYMKGKYACTARSGLNYKPFFFDVHISGVESPKINKSIGEYRIKDGENAEIQCPITHGIPKPTIMWYFEDASGTSFELEENEDNETIILTNVTRDSTNVWNYRCNATNDIGSDFHRIKLIIEYPPEIKDDKTTIVETNVGEKQYMDCIVDGQPTPAVKWLLNDTELILSSRHGRAYKSHGFNFYVTEKDTGVYICQATNKYGTVNKTIDLRVFRPATIKVPAKTAFNVLVGDNLALPCDADGYPKPYLKWVFQSSALNTEPQDLSSRHNRDGSLSLKRVQIKDDGYYICQAKNSGGPFNIAYEVKVLSPPTITNIFPEKTFTALLGDLSLRIPCKATGRPIPQITWMKDGVEHVAAGTDFYDIEDDGTLVIKEISKESAGSYQCEARNSVGSSTELYEVVVDAYHTFAKPTSIVMMEQGQSKALTCDLPPKRYESYHWYKDGTEVSMSLYSPKHHIIAAKSSDAGVYSCAVGNSAKRQSSSVRVIVGSKPKFLYNEKENIEFESGLVAVMDCAAQGYPKPEISWWFNGKQLPVTDSTYIFNMKRSNKGLYLCLVKNDFGDIHRKFVIS